MIRSRRTFLYSLPCALALAACGGGDSNAAGNPAGGAANTPAATPTEIRISAIPDFNKGKLEETVGTVVAFLAKATGLKVVYEPSSDYSAAVNGLVANKLDLVWYGGLTTVDAQDAAGKDAELLACRDIDLKFKTYFIANPGTEQSPDLIRKLEDEAAQRQDKATKNPNDATLAKDAQIASTASEP